VNNSIKFVSSLIFSLFLTSASVAALDLTTTNVGALNGFLVAAEQPRPLKVLIFGDSMANPYQSIGCVLMEKLTAKFGIAGQSIDNFHNLDVTTLTNGATALDPWSSSSHWFTYLYQLPPGSSMTWWSYGDPNGVPADNVGVYYVQHTNGGLFSFSVSTNGGAWSQPLLTLDGYSDYDRGVFTNIALPGSRYRLRFDSLTGTNLIIGPDYTDSTSTGIKIQFIEAPGISLEQVTNVSRSIRDPIFNALSPDILVWHMKEEGTEATRERMIENENWWSKSIPNCSILYIGTPYTISDSTITPTMDQNEIVRSIALEYGRAYMDCMTPSISYDWMVSQNFMFDGVHPNYDGNIYLANFVWDSVGFFALRTPRKLTVSQTGINYATASGLRYNLQILDKTWRTISSILGDGSIVSTNFGPGIFRLEIRPN
jgi:hypothetical protein